ncbi:helix-turn-helix transcriptional regulator [Ramlibacter sp. AN1015]|uniref:helix-turn-helix transcriptional regulator n=1 Tax=Ramlibacter sp. AN1015 TaxID=3133428 RepID=UPI0030C1E780
MELATTLEDARLAQQVTFEELAAAAGLSRLATRRVLRAESAPRVTTLMAIADKLGLELVLVPRQVAAGLAAPASSQRPLSRVEQLKFGTDALARDAAADATAAVGAPAAPAPRRTRVSRSRKGAR